MNDTTISLTLIKSMIRRFIAPTAPKKDRGQAFAPVNIALCKYWGKRDALWNLPETNSLSISLGSLGATTQIQLSDASHDQIFLNGELISASTPFAKRTTSFLDLFRHSESTYYHIETTVNVPVAAGLASSAAGFAALVLALNHLYDWQLESKQLSILARLGSGSACRSIWHGFVEWHKGEEVTGADSHGVPMMDIWPALRLGLLIVSAECKSISSRLAMEKTRATSLFYPAWKDCVTQDLARIKEAISTQNFVKLGEASEANAQALHALMMTTLPSIVYANADTVALWHKVWALRAEGCPVYFTQDAGPNLKLLFQAQDTERLLLAFKDLKVIAPFGSFQAPLVSFEGGQK